MTTLGFNSDHVKGCGDPHALCDGRRLQDSINIYIYIYICTVMLRVESFVVTNVP